MKSKNGSGEVVTVAVGASTLCVLVAVAAAAAIICLTECFHVCAHRMACTANRNWSRLYATLRCRIVKDTIWNVCLVTSTNLFDFFFRRPILVTVTDASNVIHIHSRALLAPNLMHCIVKCKAVMETGLNGNPYSRCKFWFHKVGSVPSCRRV